MSGLRDAAKSALLVWIFTTVGLWIPGLLGWVHEVSSWAEQKGAPPFPDPSNLGFLFVAALTAAFPAAIAGLVRFIENTLHVRLLPRTASRPVGTAPRPRDEVGVVDTQAIAVVALVLVVVVILILVL